MNTYLGFVVLAKYLVFQKGLLLGNKRSALIRNGFCRKNILRHYWVDSQKKGGLWSKRTKILEIATIEKNFVKQLETGPPKGHSSFALTSFGLS